MHAEREAVFKNSAVFYIIIQHNTTNQPSRTIHNHYNNIKMQFSSAFIFATVLSLTTAESLSASSSASKTQASSASAESSNAKSTGAPTESSKDASSTSSSWSKLGTETSAATLKIATTLSNADATTTLQTTTISTYGGPDIDPVTVSLGSSVVVVSEWIGGANSVALNLGAGLGSVAVLAGLLL
ncbi:unnamed protein product [Ambrosiozyma monospora]|uniref:Unnamed protein product n=1 Tax=Ambrosiozyma monospora TaxID=43982 RepID=A0ACB5SSD4_AMBMO|nr:unnamed protein product [Ambrosiozyma monospora]